MATATKPEKVDKSEEYRQRAEADFNPQETASERLARLTAETAELQAQVEADERKAAAEKVAGLIRDLASAIEAQNPGKVCRSLSVRYVRPGGEIPQVVAKLKPGEPGITVGFRVVKPRKKA